MKTKTKIKTNRFGETYEWKRKHCRYCQNFSKLEVCKYHQKAGFAFAFGFKRCSICKKYKTLDRFNKDKKSRDGLKSWCNRCKSFKEYEYREKAKMKGLPNE